MHFLLSVLCIPSTLSRFRYNGNMLLFNTLYIKFCPLFDLSQCFVLGAVSCCCACIFTSSRTLLFSRLILLRVGEHFEIQDHYLYARKWQSSQRLYRRRHASDDLKVPSLSNLHSLAKAFLVLRKVMISRTGWFIFGRKNSRTATLYFLASVSSVWKLY